MVFKKIGILGGMGPETSANFYYKIIHYCQKKYQATQDTDFPPMVIYSLPLFGFDELGIVNKKLVLQQLLQGIEILEKAGCDFIVIPCNTVHYFINEMRIKSTIPIISIMEETVKKIKLDNHNIVGLLASETTLKLKLYQKILDGNNIKCLTPINEDYQFITDLILEIMSGEVKGKTKREVISIIKKMVMKSTDAVILGCTEIPLAITQKDVNIKVYDTLQILAESAVCYAIKD
ncbi:amino acid racemase [archaeon]|jgi:aspartate racemase|nr:amino acid racemase [archaeon]MBT3451410.1 amino acid racemase [archaeon]MBT6869245.1 amino acid racemase [archaeon]MBT7193643.1 amino acid racemase [archaeon]MBT7380261.1 amino acid racemase [archaeon]